MNKHSYTYSSTQATQHSKFKDLFPTWLPNTLLTLSPLSVQKHMWTVQSFVQFPPYISILSLRFRNVL